MYISINIIIEFDSRPNYVITTCSKFGLNLFSMVYEVVYHVLTIIVSLISNGN